MDGGFILNSFNVATHRTEINETYTEELNTANWLKKPTSRNVQTSIGRFRNQQFVECESNFKGF